MTQVITILLTPPPQMRQLSTRLGPELFSSLPRVWDHVAVMAGEGEGGASIELAARILVVLIPHLQGAALERVK
jgi:hypothetical protein